MERAFSISRTLFVLKPTTPLMAYVEEEISEEPIQVPSESLLFTVPEDLQFPNINTNSTNAQDSMEGTTDIIEEELSEEFLHKAPSVSIQDKINKVEEEIEKVKEEVIGNVEENHPVLPPPPLTVIPEFNPTLPPLFNPKKLELIFDLRSHMTYQLHHDTITSHRINILFDAFSNAPEKQRSPTCVSPFMLQPSDDPLTGTPNDIPPGAND